MTRQRYVIEAAPDDAFHPVLLTECTADGEAIYSTHGSGYPDADAAKAAAEEEHPGLRWKPARPAWQPDTLWESSTYEEESYNDDND